MRGTLKTPYGERDGRLVNVSTVEGGKACGCICPGCGSPLIAHKGPKTVHHFAHESEATCNPETLLHILGKRLLLDRIQAAIRNKTELPIQWDCAQCDDRHDGDLVKRATRVEMEFDLGPCRPDLTLFGPSGKPVALVEIVVSHAPDENVAEFAKASGAPIVQFDLRSVEDLERIAEADVLVPTVLDLCRRPKCAGCGDPLSRLTLRMFPMSCTCCRRPTRLVALEGEGYPLGTSGMTADLARLARERGATLERRYNRWEHAYELVNVCPSCGAANPAGPDSTFVGTIAGETATPAGYICANCVLQPRATPPGRSES
jgi:ssDNA-binding Zn-finger/Zn-ribbon topoisomerase 1